MRTIEGALGGSALRGAARSYPDGHRIAPHDHERGQIVHATAGVMEMTALDRLWLIPPQRALWIPPGLPHGLRALGAVELRSVYVHPAAIPAGYPQTPGVITVSSLLRELLIRAAAVPADYAQDSQDGLIMALILREVAWQERVPWCLPMGRDPRLARVCAAFLARPADPRTLAQWGQATGASSRTLARLFTAETGLSFQHWRQQARVVLALPMLAAGLPVSVVAADMGYETPAAFSAVFRRFTGMAPARFMMAESA